MGPVSLRIINCKKYHYFWIAINATLFAVWSINKSGIIDTQFCLPGSGAGAGGVWKAGNLEIWESGNLEIREPGNLEIWDPTNPKNENSQNQHPCHQKCWQGLD